MQVSIEGTNKTPAFKITNNRLLLEGRSIPEDAVEYYSKIRNHIEEFVNEVDGSLIFDFKFDYINSASKKSVMQLFKYLEENHKKNKTVVVNWYYENGDADMKETGQDLKELLSLPFNLLSM